MDISSKSRTFGFRVLQVPQISAPKSGKIKYPNKQNFDILNVLPFLIFYFNRLTSFWSVWILVHRKWCITYPNNTFHIIMYRHRVQSEYPKIDSILFNLPNFHLTWSDFPCSWDWIKCILLYILYSFNQNPFCKVEWLCHLCIRCRKKTNTHPPTPIVSQCHLFGYSVKFVVLMVFNGTKSCFIIRKRETQTRIFNRIIPKFYCKTSSKNLS